MKSQLKIYTSFVSPLTFDIFVLSNYLPIFIIRNISNSSLIGKYSGTAIHFKELSPSTDLFRQRRDGLIDFNTFSKKYVIEISSINFLDIVKKLEYLKELSNATGIVLMGYGSDYKKCHRSLLSNILNSSELILEEIKEIIL